MPCPGYWMGQNCGQIREERTSGLEAMEVAPTSVSTSQKAGNDLSLKLLEKDSDRFLRVMSEYM
jgi:hypothetical protein